MCHADIDCSTCWRKLKGIGEKINDNLVEVAAVNPYWQFRGVVFVVELDALGFGLLGEERMNVANKANQVRFAHMHLHLPFVNLSQVHHLVDEAENAFRIASDDLIGAASAWVVIVFDE